MGWVVTCFTEYRSDMFDHLAARRRDGQVRFGRGFPAAVVATTGPRLPPAPAPRVPWWLHRVEAVGALDGAGGRCFSLGA
jgi:hypothetical protein